MFKWKPRCHTSPSVLPHPVLVLVRLPACTRLGPGDPWQLCISPTLLLSLTDNYSRLSTRFLPVSRPRLYKKNLSVEMRGCAISRVGSRGRSKPPLPSGFYSELINTEALQYATLKKVSFDLQTEPERLSAHSSITALKNPDSGMLYVVSLTVFFLRRTGPQWYEDHSLWWTSWCHSVGWNGDIVLLNPDSSVLRIKPWDAAQHVQLMAGTIIVYEICAKTISRNLSFSTPKVASEDTRRDHKLYERPHHMGASSIESFSRGRAWPSVMYNACSDSGAEFMELKEGQKSTPYETPSMFTFAWEWNSFFCSAGWEDTADYCSTLRYT